MTYKSGEYDVVIVGAGIAGLSAALFLARARRRVLVFNGGPMRISAIPFVHEYIGHEGMTPREIQARGIAEAENFGTEFISQMVDKILTRPDGCFDIWSNNQQFEAKTLVLATGLKDMLPKIPGIRESWGIDVHVCPCFSGYEVQNKRLVVFGLHQRLAQSAKFLTAWSGLVTIISPESFDHDVAQRLLSAGVTVIKDEISSLVKQDNRLTGVLTRLGLEIPCDGIFISSTMTAASDLAKSICEVDEHGFAKTDANGKTSRPGVWAIGNASDPIAHLVHAAAAGTNAGPWINDYLIEKTLISRAS